MPPQKRSRNQVTISTIKRTSRASQSYEMDDYDSGDNLTRAEKSKRAAKARRDKESELMDKLAESLPYDEETLEKVDKGNLIRLAITYIQMKGILHGDQGSSRKSGSTGTKGRKAASESARRPPPVTMLEPKTGSNEAAEGRLLLEVLHSFVVFIHTSGRILFVSDNVEDHLGLPQVNLIGRAIGDFIHPEDSKELMRQMKLKRRKSHADAGGERKVMARLFYIRMKFYFQRNGARTRQSGYKLVQFSGRVQLQSTESSAVQGLLCLCRPMQVPSILEIRMDGNMFMSRHDLRMTFTFCDPRIVTLVGYEPSELIGRTAYYFHNPLDVKKVSNCHSNLIVKGTSVSKYYRFMGKQGSWVWLQTRATIIYNTKNKPQYIVCMNYVIGEEEGQRYLMMEQEQQGFRDPNIQGCLDVHPTTPSPPTSHRSDDTGYGSGSSSAAASPKTEAAGGMGDSDGCSPAKWRHSATQTARPALSTPNPSAPGRGPQGSKGSDPRLVEMTLGVDPLSPDAMETDEVLMDVEEEEEGPLFACSLSAAMEAMQPRSAKRLSRVQSSLELPRGGKTSFCVDDLHAEELDSLRPGDVHSPTEAASPGDEDMMAVPRLPDGRAQSARMTSGDELASSPEEMQGGMDGAALAGSDSLCARPSTTATTVSNPMMSMSDVGMNVGGCCSPAASMSSDIFASSGMTTEDMDPFFFFSNDPLPSDLGSMRGGENDMELISLLNTIGDMPSLSTAVTTMEEGAGLGTSPLPTMAMASPASQSLNPQASPKVTQQNGPMLFGDSLESLVHFCHSNSPEKIAVSPNSVCGMSTAQSSLSPLGSAEGGGGGGGGGDGFATSKLSTSRPQPSGQGPLPAEQENVLEQMLMASRAASSAGASSPSSASSGSPGSSPAGPSQSSSGRSLPQGRLSRPRSASQQSLLRTLLDKEELSEEELGLLPVGAKSAEPSPSASRCGGSFEADVASLSQLRRLPSSEASARSHPKNPSCAPEQDVAPRLSSLLSLQMGVPSPLEYSPGGSFTPSSYSLPDDLLDFAMQYCEDLGDDQSQAMVCDLADQMLSGNDESGSQSMPMLSRSKLQSAKTASLAASTSGASSSGAQQADISHYDVQRSCHHDHAYFATQEPRRNCSPLVRNSAALPSPTPSQESQLSPASPRMFGSPFSGDACHWTRGRLSGKMTATGSGKLQAMLTLTQVNGMTSLSSPYESSGMQPSPRSQHLGSPLSDSGSCCSASSSMSELEKHLRGFVPKSPNSSRRSSSANGDSVPFLQKLLTGELSQEHYREIDHKLIALERQNRTALHKSLPDMRV